MTVLPWVSFSYNRIYYDLFAAYERRLNKALRGRGVPNEELPAAEGNNGAGQQIDGPADDDVAVRDEDEGYLAQALRVGNAVLNMIGDDNNDEGIVAEIELEIGPDEDEEAAVQQLQEELNDLVGSDSDQGIVVVEEQEQGPERPEAGAQPAVDPAEDSDDAAAPPPAIRLEPRAPANQPAPAPEVQPAPVDGANNNNNQAPEEPIREARGTSTTLTDLVNGVVSALTFPLVCWASGEVLRHTLPSNWVTRQHPRMVTGLLQEQWGRSLVGGAVFIVARDMVNLYTKHRRVEVRKHRRVRNVPRRKGKGGGSSSRSRSGRATPAA